MYHAPDFTWSEELWEEMLDEHPLLVKNEGIAFGLRNIFWINF